ncbi:MAG: GGDEF domain-containing protein [Anaerolineaceae bacterium]|nr:GGDEF domain-containing protein [Anaerolineaceae bacterium]
MKKNQGIRRTLDDFFFVRLKPNELENNFRAESLARDKIFTKIIILLATILAIVFLQLEVSLNHENGMHSINFQVRIAAILVSLIAFWLVHKQSLPQKIDRITFVWGIFFISHLIYFNVTRIDDYVPIIIWDIMTLFWVYFLLPIPIHYRMYLASFLTICSVVIWINFRVPVVDAYQNITVLTAYLMANVVGIFNSRQTNQMRQQNFILINTDTLTGISNRRYIFDQLDRELQRTKRYKDPLTLLLLDLDNLKAINDKYGHKAGDELLVVFTRHCSLQIRSIDYFARFGGDEFMILLIQTDQEQAQTIAERIRKSVSELEIKWDQETMKTSVSVGVTTTKDAVISPEDLVKLADDALYQAKNNGRNQIMVA